MEEKEDLIEMEAGIVRVAVVVGSGLILGMRVDW
jgi:hypothetical protein